MAAVLGRLFKRGLGRRNDSPDAEVYYNDRGDEILDSPFAAFLIVTIALNGVSVLAGISSQFDLHYHGARGSFMNWLDSWYFANAIFGIINILGGLYLVRKIEQKNLPIDEVDFNNNQNSNYIPEAQAYQISAADGSIMYPPNNPSSANAPAGLFRVDSARNRRGSSGERPMTEPNSWARIKYVLCEDSGVACFIMIFGAFLIWHYFMDIPSYHKGMRLVMRCNEIFTMAGPASFAFCVVMLLIKRREL